MKRWLSHTILTYLLSLLAIKNLAETDSYLDEITCTVHVLKNPVLVSSDICVLPSVYFGQARAATSKAIWVLKDDNTSVFTSFISFFFKVTIEIIPHFLILRRSWKDQNKTKT